MKKLRWTPGCSGMAAGLPGGLLGAGGGVILTPLLLRVHRLPEKQALATSLAIMLPLSGVSLLTYALRGQLFWQEALPYAAGGMVGGFLAGKLMKRLPGHWLRRGFGLLLLLAGARSLLT